jgi:hypothetical protein
LLLASFTLQSAFEVCPCHSTLDFLVLIQDSLVCIFWGWVVRRIEFRASHLLGICFITWTMPPAECTFADFICLCMYVCLYVCIYLSTGIWTQSLTLARQEFYPVSRTPVLFLPMWLVLAVNIYTPCLWVDIGFHLYLFCGDTQGWNCEAVRGRVWWVLC